MRAPERRRQVGLSLPFTCLSGAAKESEQSARAPRAYASQGGALDHRLQHGALDGARQGARHRIYLTVIASPLRSTFANNPTCRPVNSSTAPFWLVSTIARAPVPTASPAPAAP
jgi:hypothetical protein